MHVNRVRLEAFKSLYDVTCGLDHFTVITGPNGAGKSNLVDALNFLGEVYGDGLEFAVGRAGGYDNIAHRRTRRAKRPVAIEVVVTVDAHDLRQHHSPYRLTDEEPAPIPKNAALVYRHLFSFGTATQSLISDFEIRSDHVTIGTADGKQIVSVWRRPEGKTDLRVARKRLREEPWLRDALAPFGNPGYEKFLLERPFSTTSLVTELMVYGAVPSLIQQALGRTKIFQLSPYQCRTTGVPTPNATLERHGENLPGAADHLRRNAGDAWTRVQSAMRSIVPGLQAIEIVYTEDRRLALQFREKGVGRPWSTGEVSDGTIQALALFIALYDERNPLLVIEEPENSVHPWILRQFLDLCTEEQRKQIVVTTHSPVVLDYVNPETVRLMYLSEGRSHIAGLLEFSPELRELVLSGELSVFGAYDSGFLSETVPRGFAPESNRDES